MSPTFDAAAGRNNGLVYRRLLPTDTAAVMELAIQGLRPGLYPGHLDRAKVRATVERFASSDTDWHLVAFDGDRPVALAAVAVQEHPWFERWQAVVVALYSAVPGAGRRLVREMFAWYEAQPMLRSLLWSLEFDAEPRMMRIAERMGFNSFNVVATNYKV